MSRGVPAGRKKRDGGCRTCYGGEGGTERGPRKNKWTGEVLGGKWKSLYFRKRRGLGSYTSSGAGKRITLFPTAGEKRQAFFEGGEVVGVGEGKGVGTCCRTGVDVSGWREAWFAALKERGRVDRAWL